MKNIRAQNILFLCDDIHLVKEQLNGHKLTSIPELHTLRDDISTDEIIPVSRMYHYDDKLKHYAHIGFETQGEKPIEKDTLVNGGFNILVAGKRYGKGSSREHAPLAEISAGIELVFAESFEYIYQQNAANIGLLTSTNFSLLEALMRGESIDIEAILKGYSPLSAEIVRSGGLIPYGEHQSNLNHIESTSTKPQSYTEKILRRHLLQGEYQAGSDTFIKGDWRFTHEAYCGMAEYLLSQHYPEPLPLHQPEKIVIFEEHFAYRHRSTHYQNLGVVRKFDALGEATRNFAKKYPVNFHGLLKDQEGSEGITHPIMIERYALPGEVVVGTESHTTHIGAIGAFTAGVGTTNMANAMVTGQVRFSIPKVVNIHLTGQLKTGVMAKDIVLYLLSRSDIKSGALIGKAIEYTGEIIDALGIDERATLTNMAVEMGAVTGIVAPDAKTISFLKEHRNIDFIPKSWMQSDKDANYAKTFHIDCSDISAMISAPGDPGNALYPQELSEAINIDIAYGGSCTAGKKTDFDHYYKVLNWAYNQGLEVHKNVKLYLQYGSINVLKYCQDKGYTALFNQMGIEILNPQCGACCGCGPGASSHQEQITISSINRNFPGRSGPGKVWLGNPETVIASAIMGRICSFEQLQQSYKESSLAKSD